MQTHLQIKLPTARIQRAFSLLELLVAISIMVLIIFALYQIFSQTQKAMRGNMTQVDVLESGRAAMEMISRELEQISASGFSEGVNLYAGMIPIPRVVQADIDQVTPLRTNVLQELFFLSERDNQWHGTGYRVLWADNGVGTLFRHGSATNRHRLSNTNLMGQFVHAVAMTNTVTGAISTNYHRVADGVIHFRITAYDPEGRRLGFDTTNIYPSYGILRVAQNGSIRPFPYSTAPHVNGANVILRQDPFDQFRRETQLVFLSNALPAYVELELGVLEPATLKQYESLRGTTVGQDFLRRQAAKVHLFRQRIPIRTGSQ
jgi:prepilin-type N-terminal cleavage/methylation domain-containing protein